MSNNDTIKWGWNRDQICINWGAAEGGQFIANYHDNSGYIWMDSFGKQLRLAVQDQTTNKYGSVEKKANNEVIELDKLKWKLEVLSNIYTDQYGNYQTNYSSMNRYVLTSWTNLPHVKVVPYYASGDTLVFNFNDVAGNEEVRNTLCTLAYIYVDPTA